MACQAAPAALPFQATVQTRGEPAPVSAPLETAAKDEIAAGEIAFRTEGHCNAIGFGKMPLAQGNTIRPAATTDIRADAERDVRRLNTVRQGTIIRITAVNP